MHENAINSRIALKIQLLTLLLASSGVMAGGINSFGIGYEYTSGSYGLDKDTEITTIPFFAQHAHDALRTRVSIPYISVTGDGSIIPGSHGGMSSTGMLSTPMGPGATMSTRETKSGLGDITTSLSYALPPRRGSYMFYELTVEIKWGTASASRNLGTGKDDSSLSLFSLYDKGKLKPYLVLGYLTIGDTALVNYNDVIFITPGLIYQVDPRTSFSVSYEYEQATTDNTDDGRLVRLYATRTIDREWSASFYLLNGSSDSEADFGVGFTLMNSFQ